MRDVRFATLGVRHAELQMYQPRVPQPHVVQEHHGCGADDHRGGLPQGSGNPTFFHEPLVDGLPFQRRNGNTILYV